MRDLLTKVFCTALLVGSLAVTADAAVIGRPQALNIELTQGVSTLVSAPVNILPADPLDGSVFYKIVDNYDYPGMAGSGQTSVYFSIQMGDPSPEAEYSTMHIRLRAANPAWDVVRGAEPLFHLDEGGVEVSITDMSFMSGALQSLVAVHHLDNVEAAASYMMNYDEGIPFGSYYYATPNVVDFFGTRQVPQSEYVDADPSEHNFVGDLGTVVDPLIDVAWENIAPAVYDGGNGGYPVHFNQLGFDDYYDGDVFELGIAANVYAIENVPEPSTVGLLVLGGLACLRRRRK